MSFAPTLSLLPPTLDKKMTKIIATSIFLALLVFVGCKNKSTASDGWIIASDDGYSYSYNSVIIDVSECPIFVIGKFSDGDKRYYAEWISAGKSFTISGVEVKSRNKPVLYYADNGIVKNLEIENEGDWIPLFKKDGPSVAELEAVFVQLQSIQ